MRCIFGGTGLGVQANLYGKVFAIDDDVRHECEDDFVVGFVDGLGEFRVGDGEAALFIDVWHGALRIADEVMAGSPVVGGVLYIDSGGGCGDGYLAVG